MIEIVQAASPARVNQVRGLIVEYVRWLNMDLSFQSFAEELASLPGKYVPPEGRLLLAVEGAQAAGCAALRRIDANGDGAAHGGGSVCEMKRLYVRPAYRRRGLGRTLAEAILAEARVIGYARIRLDTANFMRAAPALYRNLGFQVIEPYYPVPAEMRSQITFMERGCDPS